MKGISSSMEFMGKIMIVVFIVGVIIILLMTFLPRSFDTFCVNKQFESINDVISDASFTRSITIKPFVVESCMEFVDFSAVKCTNPDEFYESSLEGDRRCYETLRVGQVQGNCEDIGLKCESVCEDKDACGEDCDPNMPKCEGDFSCSADCSLRKGSFNVLPGNYDVLEITSEGQNLKLTPGRYSVEIGPYSVKFLGKQTDLEENG